MQKNSNKDRRKDCKKELSARASASKIIHECLASGVSLNVLLPRYLEQTLLEQRSLAQEISFGVLRWYYRLNPLLNSMLSKPLRGKKESLHYLLLVGLYQINYLDKVEYAVVKETVNACDELQQSWAKGLVNAILRRFIREKEDLLAQLNDSYSSRFAYPEWLIKSIKDSWKGIEFPLEAVLEAGNQRPPMTLRINAQFDYQSYKEQLNADNFSFFEPAIAQANNYALVLEKPVAVDKLPFFAQGRLSVQDAAPQLAAALLAAQPDDLILDACAAPGGKTMHLFEMQPLVKKIIALDVSAERLQRVKENQQRLNVAEEKLVLISADASRQDWWDGQLFDRILLDAPCSATGVIRRHPDIKVLRREQDIAELVSLQADILDNLWQMLKPGGLLLYATCSIIREENDRQIEAFLSRKAEDAEDIVIDDNWGRAMPFGRQILPGEQNMDGFYYALLRKPVS